MKTPFVLAALAAAFLLASAADAGAQQPGDRINGIVTYRQPGSVITVKGVWVYGKGPMAHAYREMKNPTWTCGEEGMIEHESVFEQDKERKPDCDRQDPDCAKEWERYKQTPVKTRTVAVRRYVSPDPKLCLPAKNGAWLGRLALDPATKSFHFEEPHFKALGDLDHLQPEDYTVERWNSDGELIAPRPKKSKSLDAGSKFSGTYDPKATKLEGVWRDARLDAEDAEDHGNEGHEHHEFVITYSFDLVPQEPKLTLQPASKADYESWIPAPVKSDDPQGLFKGKGLRFTAELKPEKKGGPVPKARIEFRLRDVSRETGQCVNFPKDAAETSDLRFAPNQPGIVVTSETSAHTADDVSSATIVVEATDTGATGFLEASATDAGAAVVPQTGKTFVPLPFDENGNSVADAWEKERGILASALLARFDEDAIPAGQRRNGDGYVFFEEYRGFVVLDGASGKKKFVRTSPLKKDLFVHDKNGLFRKYYEAYDAAKLEYHYVSPDLIQVRTAVDDPAHRWVNFNSTTRTMYARQYAVVIQSEPTPPANDAYAVGEVVSFLDAVPGGARKKYEQPLRYIHAAKFFETVPETVANENAQALNTPELRAEFIRRNLESTIIHEIGHAIGISHHTKSRKKHRDGAAQDADEANGGMESGIPDCAMRYLNRVDVTNVPEQTRYCRAGEYGTDDCFGQIDVKTDP